MRVLWFGDLAPTGFGSVTTDIGRRLLDLGVDVRFVSQNDTGDELPEPFRSRTVNLISLPMVEDAWTGESGVDKPAEGIAGLMDGTIKAIMHDGSEYAPWKPDACIVLADFMAARHIIGRYLDAFASVPTFHYCPVEGVDLPPSWKMLWDVAHPVAMSHFGAAEIAKVTGVMPPTIYHGVTADDFYPVSRERPIVITAEGKPDAVLTSKKACRQAFLPAPLPPEHPVFREVWVLRTDRHMPRKRYNSFIRSMAPMVARNPRVRVIMHCRVMDQGGFLLDTLGKYPAELRARMMPTPSMTWLWPLDEKGERMMVPLPRPVLNALYNACDIYASNSAEGFGLTIAEALACGVPAVGVGYSAVPEVIGPAGTVVAEGGLIDNEYDHFWWAADEPAFGKAVEFLVTHQTKREDLGRKGPAHIATNFTWSAAAESFRDLLASAVPSEVAA